MILQFVFYLAICILLNRTCTKRMGCILSKTTSFLSFTWRFVTSQNSDKHSDIQICHFQRQWQLVLFVILMESDKKGDNLLLFVTTLGSDKFWPFIIFVTTLGSNKFWPLCATSNDKDVTIRRVVAVLRSHHGSNWGLIHHPTHERVGVLI